MNGEMSTKSQDPSRRLYVAGRSQCHEIIWFFLQRASRNRIKHRQFKAKPGKRHLSVVVLSTARILVRRPMTASSALAHLIHLLVPS